MLLSGRDRIALSKRHSTDLFYQYLVPPGRKVAEGVQLARQCGLALYLVELLAEKAEILLAQGAADAAESSAREAMELASGQQVQFLWGAALAGHLLGQALVQQGKIGAARKALHEVLTGRKRIGDPRTCRRRSS